MSGFTAGLVSILTLVVVGSILATLVKNPQGTGTLLGAATTGFSNILIASQGSVTSLATNMQSY